MSEEKSRVTSGSLITVIRRICYRFDMEDYNELGEDAKFVVKLLASKHFVDLSDGYVQPLDDTERLRRTEEQTQVDYAPTNEV